MKIKLGPSGTVDILTSAACLNTGRACWGQHWPTKGGPGVPTFTSPGASVSKEASASEATTQEPRERLTRKHPDRTSDTPRCELAAARGGARACYRPTVVGRAGRSARHVRVTGNVSLGDKTPDEGGRRWLRLVFSSKTNRRKPGPASLRVAIAGDVCTRELTSLHSESDLTCRSGHSGPTEFPGRVGFRFRGPRADAGSKSGFGSEGRGALSCDCHWLSIRASSRVRSGS